MDVNSLVYDEMVDSSLHLEESLTPEKMVNL